jgi:hypothetical protein
MIRSVLRRRGRRVALLGLAALQAVAPLLVTAFGGGAFTTADRAGEPAIVPAGYAFSIWGVIQVLSLAYAVWAFPDGRPSPALRDRLAGPLAVTFAGFSAWLVAAEVEPVWSTLAILLAMVAGLVVAVDRALAARSEIRGWGRLGAALLWATAGLYLGWTSVAVWLNLTTALVQSGAPLDGPAGVGGQLAVLLGVTATAVTLVRRTRALPAYVAAVAWAYVGAVIGAADAGQPVLAAAAGTGLAVVLAATATTVLRTPRPAPEPAR